MLNNEINANKLVLGFFWYLSRIILLNDIYIYFNFNYY